MESKYFTYSTYGENMVVIRMTAILSEDVLKINKIRSRFKITNDEGFITMTPSEDGVFLSSRGYAGRLGVGGLQFVMKKSSIDLPRVRKSLIVSRYELKENGVMTFNMMDGIPADDLILNKEKDRKLKEDVYLTCNYDQFNYLQGNRFLNYGLVESLVSSMSQEMLDFCIVVNEKMEIIDGQNRLEACKILGKPVKYKIVSGYGIEQVRMYNQYGVNWTNKDAVNLFCAKGNKNYIDLKSFCKETGIQLTMAVNILGTRSACAGVGGRSMPVDKLKTGEFVVIAAEFGREFAEFINKIYRYTPKAKKSSFVSAMLTVYRNKIFKPQEFAEKLKMRSAELEGRTTRKEFLEVIERIYNYGRHERIALY